MVWRVEQDHKFWRYYREVQLVNRRRMLGHFIFYNILLLVQTGDFMGQSDTGLGGTVYNAQRNVSNGDKEQQQQAQLPGADAAKRRGFVCSDE